MAYALKSTYEPVRSEAPMPHEQFLLFDSSLYLKSRYFANSSVPTKSLLLTPVALSSQP